MSKGIIFTDYEVGDEYAIMELHNQVFDTKISIDFWRWLFEENPVRPPCIKLAKVGDKLIGHFAVFPVKMKFGDKIVIASKSCLTMTHPMYRGKGIFINLADRLFSEIRERGVLLTIGNPNKNSYGVFTRRAGYENLFGKTGIPYLVKPINIKSIINKYFSNVFFRELPNTIISPLFGFFGKNEYSAPTVHVSINRAHSFDERIDKFWKQISEEHRIATVRDKDYLSWRYLQSPGRQYAIFIAEENNEIRGYVILRDRNLFGLRAGLIVDILTVSSDSRVSQALLRRSVDYFISQNLDVVACLMLKHHSCYDELKKLGFREIPPVLRPRNFHYTIRFNNEESKLPFGRNPSNWFLTWGDTEDG